MKNLKKFFAVLVVVTLLVSSLVMPASAADSFSYADQANKLNDLGLYKGISTEKFVPDLGTALNRETGVVMLLRIVGLDKTAEAMTDAEATAALAKFKDAKTISTWAKKSVAYATKNALVVGTTTTTFAPKASLNGKAYCTLILRQLGFKVEGAAYDVAPTTLSEKGAFTAAEGTKFTGKAALIKDDLVGISYGSLNAKDSEGKVLFVKLVDAKVITAEAAAKNGLTTAVLSSVTATNGAINVVFDKDIVTAPAATDFTVSQSVYAASETPTVTTVTASVYGYTAATKTAELKVAPVTDAAAKSLYYTVTFKNGTPITSAAITFADVTLSSAASLSSKVVEVSLSAATTATAAAGATYTVKDSAGAAINVTKAELAAYDTDNKTVLLTLASDTKAGSLYSLTVGSKTVNFGGKAPETTKPTIKGVSSTGYKEVTIEYSEAVVLTGTTVTIAEAYGSRAALAVKGMKYNGKTKIVVETDEQKGTTLYATTVTGTADFAGNVMDKDDNDTFAGTAKSTDLIEVAGAASNNPEEAIVEFNVNIDPATIAATAFKVEEAYGSKTVLPVTAVRVATKDDKAVNMLDKVAENAVKKYVVITVPGTKTSTLYKVTATGLKSETGMGMTTTDSKTNTTFAGTAKPTDPYTVEVLNNSAESNTVIKVKSQYKVVKAEAEKVENYAIALAYGSKATLAVKSAELQSDEQTVKLTTASMSADLYKLTVTGIKDVYGNSVKTADSANVLSFSGLGIAEKISSITEIKYATDSDTQILVTFNKNVGSSVSDPAHYSINNDVGYPEKAEAVTDVPNQVKLTLPKLTKDKIYTLTVKGLENADGIAMDSAGVTLTFVGKGNAATAPQITGVVPEDNQTLKIYFDRDVKDSTVDGKVWDSNTNLLKDGILKYVKGTAAAVDLEDADEYAYQDSSDKNVLVVRIDTPTAFKDNVSYKLTGDNSAIDADHDELAFVYKTSDPAAIVVENVVPLNKRTVRIYFNQPVYGTLATFADIATESNASYGADANIALLNPAAIDSTKKVYDFATDEDMASKRYYLIHNPAVEGVNAILKDTPQAGSGYVALKDEDTSTTGVQHNRPFAGSGASVSDIKDVYAVMEDNRTIKVYYPTAMLEADVINAANYDLVKSTATDAAGINIGDPAAEFNSATDIGEIVYKADDKTATITLNKAIAAGTTVYIKFATTINNSTSTAQVKDGTSAICKQFAVSTAASKKVELAEASYSAGVITIKMNQRFTTTADITTAADALAALNITLKRGATAANYTLVAGEVTGVVLADKDGKTVGVTYTSGTAKEIRITINTAAGHITDLTDEAVGKVEIKSEAAFTGINGNNGNDDVSVVFAQ